MISQATIRCCRCHEQKTETEFSPSVWARSTAGTCRQCTNARDRERKRARGGEATLRRIEARRMRQETRASGLIFCSPCGRALDPSAFYPSDRANGAGWCRECHAASMRKRYEADPTGTRERNRGYRAANLERYLAAEAKRRGSPEYRAAAKHRGAKWRAGVKADPVRAERKAEQEMAASLRRHYGITLSEYRDLLSRQFGKCACCGTETPGASRFAVDHDHRTGAVRGLLCRSCNTGIGMLGDRIEGIEQALAYLHRHAASVAADETTADGDAVGRLATMLGHAARTGGDA